MNDLLIGLLSAAMATNQPAALSNVIQQKTGLTFNVPDKNDPVEREFQKLLAEDDAAQAEMDRWIQENKKFADLGGGVGELTLKSRMESRLGRVKTAYREFLEKHPDHARAHLAFGSFLSDVNEEQNAQVEWEKGRQLDPSNPAAWNNLGNWYGHNGPATNAFAYYAKAIELNPNESTYYQNLATTVYLFRQDAQSFYNLTELQVFDKAMGLYKKALALDPENFPLATDLAQSYYGYKLPKTGDPEADRQAEKKLWQTALTAWEDALKLARDDIERQGVMIHFARIHINTGEFDLARNNLNSVTNDMFSGVKKTLTKKLENQLNKAQGTNAPAPPKSP